MDTFRISLCLLLLAAEAALAPGTQAQDGPPDQEPSGNQVVGISYIYPPNGGTILAYASTEIGGDAAAYYNVSVDATISGPSGSASGSQGPTSGEAEGLITIASGAGTFTLNSNHSVWPQPNSYTDGGSTDDGLYGDPYGFGLGGGPTEYGSGYIIVDAPLGEPDFEQITSQMEFLVGSSSWSVYGMAPVIQSVGPSNVTLGSSGTFEITGANLNAGGTDSSPTVAVTGSGLALTNVKVTDQYGYALSVDYQVDSNTTTLGTHGITVTTTAGTSNSYNVSVGDPTPSITGVTSPWLAGNTYVCGANPIQITGTGFGTDLPGISLSGGTTGIGTPVLCSGNTDTTITFGVSVSASAPSESVGVSVVSNGYQGYNGNNFASAGGNSSGSSVVYATVQAEALPVPQIMFNYQGVYQNIAGQAVAVYVGQRIDLTAVIPNGMVPTSQSWSQVQQVHSGPGMFGAVVGGYSAPTASGVLNQPSANGANVIELPSTNTCQTQAESCLTFFWVDQGTWQWQFGYYANNQYQSAVATFNVLGPAVPTFTAQAGSAVASAPGTPPSPTLALGGLQVSGQSGQVGVIFSSPAVPAAGNGGTYIWVQIVTGDAVQDRKVLNGNTITGSCIPPNSLPLLDSLYPYGLPNGNQFSISRPNDTVTDGPAVPLLSTWAEAAREFSATMYLMWDPTLPSGCAAAHNVGNTVPTANSTASSCTSIPIPMASIAWQFAADGINTLQPRANNTTWTVPCGPGTAGACASVVPGSDPEQSFPTWTGVYSGTLSCNQ